MHPKTGVIFYPPKSVIKYAKPSPAFMKDISPYYANMKKLSYAPSNMNLLSKNITKWAKGIKFSKPSKPFDYKFMKDDSIKLNVKTYAEIEELYKEFQQELNSLKRQQKMSYSDPSYYNYFSNESKNNIANSLIDWNSVFIKYKTLAKKICPQEKELANYALTLCYEKESSDKNFAWIVAENGILENCGATEFMLPIKDKFGEYEYLGKRYSLAPYKYQDLSNLEENKEDIVMLEDEENIVENDIEIKDDEGVF